jgi:hypothetical protein
MSLLVLQILRATDPRFLLNFMFQLIAGEKAEVIANCDNLERLKFSPSLPYVFTEHDVV